MAFGIPFYASVSLTVTCYSLLLCPSTSCSNLLFPNAISLFFLFFLNAFFLLLCSVFVLFNGSLAFSLPVSLCFSSLHHCCCCHLDYDGQGKLRPFVDASGVLSWLDLPLFFYWIPSPPACSVEVFACVPRRFITTVVVGGLIMTWKAIWGRH